MANQAWECLGVKYRYQADTYRELLAANGLRRVADTDSKAAKGLQAFNDSVVETISKLFTMAGSFRKLNFNAGKALV